MGDRLATIDKAENRGPCPFLGESKLGPYLSRKLIIQIQLYNQTRASFINIK